MFGGLAEEFPVYDGNEVVPVASGRGLLKIFHVLPEQERMDRLVAHHISLEELEVNWRLQDFDKISTRYMYFSTNENCRYIKCLVLYYLLSNNFFSGVVVLNTDFDVKW